MFVLHLAFHLAALTALDYSLQIIDLHVTYLHTHLINSMIQFIKMENKLQGGPASKFFLSPPTSLTHQDIYNFTAFSCTFLPDIFLLFMRSLSALSLLILLSFLCAAYFFSTILPSRMHSHSNTD